MAGNSQIIKLVTLLGAVVAAIAAENNQCYNCLYYEGNNAFQSIISAIPNLSELSVKAECNDPFNKEGVATIECPASSSCAKYKVGGLMYRTCQPLCTQADGISCCKSDKCNSSDHVSLSLVIMIVPVFILTYLFN